MKNKSQPCLFSLFVAGALCTLSAHAVPTVQQPMYVGLRLLLLAGGVVTTLIALFRFVKHGRSNSELAAKGLLTLATVLVAYSILEAAFIFVDRSAGYGTVSLASRTWFERHWQLRNSWGYRDIEPDTKKDPDKNYIFIAGDSFVAGHGIRDPKDRFSDLLREKLGPDFKVSNLGRNGNAPLDALEQLEKLPYSPDVLIFSYFVNDIDPATRAAGHRQPSENHDRRQVSPLLNTLLESSYFADYVYFSVPPPANTEYLDFVKKGFADPEIYAKHEAELSQLANFAKARKSRFMSVVFPMMGDVPGSKFYTEKVSRSLARHGPVLNLSPLIENKPPRDLIISAYDAHPSRMVHALVADELFKMIQPLKH